MINYYLIAILFILAGDVGFATAKHGMPKEGEHNIGVTLISNIIMLLLIIMAIKKGDGDI
jgi:hypothetical protein